MKSTINGIGIAYREMGSGPAVVLLHGFGLSGKMWSPQAGTLAEAGFRVIVPDLRGFGKSAVPDTPFGISTLADDIIGLLNYLGVGRAVVVGHCLGGYVLFDLIDRYSHRLAAASFTGVRGCGDGPSEIAACDELEALAASGDGEAVASRLYPRLLGPAGEEGLGAVRRWIAETDPRTLTWALAAMRSRKEYGARVRDFDLPSLILGAEADGVVELEQIRRLAAAFPNATSHIIRGAGHLANLELPEEFNDCLLDFLRSLSLALYGCSWLSDVA